MRYVWSSKDYDPDFTVRDIFLLGSFGRTYWRNIHSNVTGKDYNGFLEYQKIPSLRDLPADMMTVPYDKYDPSFNRYKIRAGSTLQDWENRGWINKNDPYGFIQWAANYEMGRRIPIYDDLQKARWRGVKKRFTGLLNKLRKEGKDTRKVQQVLLEWLIDTD